MFFVKTVSMLSFTNREEEFEKLKSNLLGRINTMLVSPRRWEEIVFSRKRSKRDRFLYRRILEFYLFVILDRRDYRFKTRLKTQV